MTRWPETLKDVDIHLEVDPVQARSWYLLARVFFNRDGLQQFHLHVQTENEEIFILNVVRSTGSYVARCFRAYVLTIMRCAKTIAQRVHFRALTGYNKVSLFNQCN
jgi:hypothetical protein